MCFKSLTVRGDGGGEGGAAAVWYILVNTQQSFSAQPVSQICPEAMRLLMILWTKQPVNILSYCQPSHIVP